MHHLTVCNGKGSFQKGVDPSAIRDLRQQRGTTIWLDLTDPAEDDLNLLRDEFQFHPLALEDVMREYERPKVDSYPDYYFIVFYSVRALGEARRLVVMPLYLFIGPNYLVTVHREEIAEISETLRRWREPHSPLGQDVAALVYALLDAIVDDYFPLMDHIAEEIEDLEQQIFTHFEESALKHIFMLKNDLFKVRRAIAPGRDVVNTLLRRDIQVFEANDMPYLQDVYDHIVRVTDTIDTYRDLLSSALDSYLSLQSNRLNQIVKVLTIASIVLMSVTLVAGIYGMNFDVMPELHWRYGYLWALGLMAGIGVGLILWFRRLKWL